MSFTIEGYGDHPVADFLHSVNDDAAKLADSPLWSLGDSQVEELVTAAARAEAQLAALTMKLIAEASGRGLAGRAGAPSIQAWLRGRLRVTPHAAAGQVRLATALQHLPDTAQALSEGRLSPGHARVIAEAVGELPDADPELRARAEIHLIAQAESFDPYQLARLGRRIWEVVDPDAADAKEAERLAELEKRAWRRRELSFTPDGRGNVFLKGRFDVESAAIVRRALDPLAKPRPTDAGLPDTRSPGARLADALTELGRRALVSGGLPSQRGERPQIIVTVDHTELRDQLGCGTLDTGEQLSPGTVRRLACDAEIIPRCSAATPCLSTWVAASDCSVPHNGERWYCGTAGAHSPVAIDRRPGQKRTTSRIG